MKISEICNLNRNQNELDFVDIDVDNDMPLFLDPYFLSIRTDRWSLSAHRTLENFFQYMLHLFKNNKIDEAQQNFRFTEPSETCLGLSKSGTQGKSIGDGDATKLFKYIIDSGVMDSGLVSHVNDIKIFVDNISHDKISDLTTNVIRKHLIQYTQNQCQLHNIELTRSIATKEYWDIHSKTWINSYEDMLVINYKPILLIPKSIVCRKRGYAYDSSQYARHFVLNFLVNEELRMNTSLVREQTLKSGAIKRFVKKDDAATKYGAYKKEFLRWFTSQYPDFYEKFKASAKNRLTALTNEELIDNYTNDFYSQIIDSLIYGFKEIKTGSKDANTFHEHIIATMTFLFYPSLINPVKEKEIHDGRKRIDLVYDNAAESGYFFGLSTVKDIPSSYIFVECKNYTKDIANPELDQLNGRFSPNRGKMGFMVFRNCSDETALFQRCSDYYNDNKNLIIPLQDKDFLKVLNQLKVDLDSDVSNSPQEEMLYSLTQIIILS
ncbi:TPA: hypothetical protein IP875_001398 [Listeria monocytogenes]|nr:hypothetical protein [Listeria monocytogenes]HAO5665498.1 hypothetical protein [Listeria monocytogenes]